MANCMRVESNRQKQGQRLLPYCTNSMLAPAQLYKAIVKLMNILLASTTLEIGLATLRHHLKVNRFNGPGSQWI